MSLIFFAYFLCALGGKADMTGEIAYLWALFSVADALWVRTIWGRK